MAKEPEISLLKGPISGSVPACIRFRTHANRCRRRLTHVHRISCSVRSASSQGVNRKEKRKCVPCGKQACGACRRQVSSAQGEMQTKTVCDKKQAPGVPHSGETCKKSKKLTLHLPRDLPVESLFDVLPSGRGGRSAAALSEDAGFSAARRNDLQKTDRRECADCGCPAWGGNRKDEILGEEPV